MKNLIKKQKPVISIIIGSDSDLEVMHEAALILEQFQISYELLIISAHRTPNVISSYAQIAKDRGIKVIITGAGGSAHLAGITAAYTTIPVIGVPIYTKTLQGLDSLYSIVQMPPGVPVATVAINGAKNAGLLALEILSVTDKSIREKLENYKQEIQSGVLDKSRVLSNIGWKKYLERMKK
jgi:5-(carboxyamino)imidazole ribonucleotide mutase